jgi:hypothetical protein
MKKLVLGCLVVFLLLAVAGGVLGYYFVYQPARQYLAAFRQLDRVRDLDREVTNTAAFAAPAAGELTEAMIARFARVQDVMQTRLGAKVQQLQRQYEQMSRSIESGGPKDARAVLTALRHLAGIVTEAKRIQVDALNQVGFSVAEYQWVRDQVYRAAGAGFTEIDVKRIWEAMRNGDLRVEPVQPRGGAGEVPEKNKALVQPYLDQIQQWIALGWLGL